MTDISLLPSSFVTILRDYPFPKGFRKKDIQLAVHCERDLIVITPELSEQLQIAAILALLNARKANTSTMIIVKSTYEARLIYQYLNPLEIDSKELENSVFSYNQRLTNYKIRVASTFSSFKGNCYTSSSNCIIISSYNHLLRNLLYRRSNKKEEKNKITLPLVTSYIFVNPFQISQNKKFTLEVIDSILFLRRKSWSNKKRIHYITPGVVDSKQLQRTFQTESVFMVTDPTQFEQDFTEDIDTQDFIQSKLPFMLLLRLNSGHPTKKELLRRLKTSVICSFISKNLSNEEREKVEKIVEEEFKLIFSKLMKNEGEEAFVLISRADEYTGRYSLTPFGRRFLLAATYFEEIMSNPLSILEIIKGKMTDKLLNWEGVAEIFHFFTNGRIAYDDFQVLIQRLETKEKQEDDDLKSIFSKKNSYSLFKIHKLLTCFQESMSESARKRLSLINKFVFSNYEGMELGSSLKDKMTILQAVKEELLVANEPLTKNQIMVTLSLRKDEVTEALTKIELQNEALQTILGKPPKGKSIKYYSFKEFPAHYFKKCGDCYFYGKNKCNFWTEIMEKAERKVPEKFLPYAQTKTLQRRTIACEVFQEAETMEITMSLSEFYDSTPTEFVSFTNEGEGEFAHYCQFCLKEGHKVHIKSFGSIDFPQQGSIPNKCLRCCSSFKLEQERLEVIHEDST